MARLSESITSNATGLFLTPEVIPGQIPANPIWRELEPNSYDNFGTELKTVQRMPINANRRNKKGTVVGYSAGAGFETDLTAANLRDLMPGFFFSPPRVKSELLASAVTADGYTVAAGGAAYVAGTLVYAEGAIDGPNNGVHKVGAGSAANNIAVTGLTVRNGQAIKVRRAGIEFAAGDAKIETGALPSLVTAAFDLTTIGLIPGEVVYLGGDGAATTFGDAGRGWCRVRAIEAHRITFDKTDFPFTANNGAGKTIRLFVGTVIRDEDANLQQQYSYSIMRQLGRPDLDAPNAIQAEIVTRCVANKIDFKIPEEDKITAALSYMGADAEYYQDVNNDVPGGTYIGPVEADAINSTGDMKRARMAIIPAAQDNSAPVPLFAVFSEYNLSIDNKIKENKAVTRLGTFVLSPGNFTVSGGFTGYFVDVAALRAVRENADVTFLMAAYKQGKGIAIDLPMVTLSSKGLDVKLNEPIMIPIDSDASTGKKYLDTMPHTALMVFFDYLPAVAND